MRAQEAAFRAVTKTVRALGKTPSRASALAAEKIRARIETQFDDGVDPYGNAWAPLAEATIAKGRHAPPLTDDAALRDITVKPLPGAGIAIELGAEYGAFHQIGTKDMPARPILPAHGLPKEWREDIVDSIDECLP